MMLYFRAVRCIPAIITVAAAALVCCGCMMPDPDAQRAKNEARLHAEGIIVPFYQTDDSGNYLTGEKDIPLLDSEATAPAFTLPMARGSEYIFDPAAATGNLLVYVIPTTQAPNSLQQLRKLSALVPELTAAGIELLAVCPDSQAIAASAAKEHGLAFSLLYDESMQFLSEYGCSTQDMEFPQRTMIGIKDGGSIVFYKRGFAFSTTPQIKKAFGLAD